jgi:hypothetical protein
MHAHRLASASVLQEHVSKLSGRRFQGRSSGWTASDRRCRKDRSLGKKGDNKAYNDRAPRLEVNLSIRTDENGVTLPSLPGCLLQALALPKRLLPVLAPWAVIPHAPPAEAGSIGPQRGGPALPVPGRGRRALRGARH